MGLRLPDHRELARVYISYLRRKTEGRQSRLIHTVRGSIRRADPRTGRLNRLLAARDWPLRPARRLVARGGDRRRTHRCGRLADHPVTVYNQLDSELVDVTAVTANWVAVDIGAWAAWTPTP